MKLRIIMRNQYKPLVGVDSRVTEEPDIVSEPKVRASYRTSAVARAWLHWTEVEAITYYQYASL